MPKGRAPQLPVRTVTLPGDPTDAERDALREAVESQGAVGVGAAADAADAAGGVTVAAGWLLSSHDPDARSNT